MARRCSGDTSDCSAASAHHMRGNTLILILIIKKGGVCSLHDIAQIGTHCSVTGDKFKIRKEDVSTMTLAAIKCRSILWCNFMINGTPSVSETRKPDKVRLRRHRALIILISAPLGKFRVIVINCMQKPRKSMALNILHLNMMNNHFVAPLAFASRKALSASVMTSEILCVSPVEKPCQY